MSAARTPEGARAAVRSTQVLRMPAALHAQGIGVALGGTPVLHGIDAVSYTHLTLPTICSV